MEGEKQEEKDAAEPSAAAEERPLNRAERRAQEHNKKSGSKPGMAGAPKGTGFISALNRGATHKSTSLPRTGHK